MSGKVSATVKAAAKRGSIGTASVALVLAVLSYGELLGDDDCRKGNTAKSKAAYKICKREAEHDRDKALKELLAAGATVFFYRFVGEGAYDGRRQRNDDVGDADVQGPAEAL